MLQQGGLIQKLKNDVRWEMIRSSKGGFLSVTSGKVLKMAYTEEKGLTLADTEGMFLLLGIGFVVAGGVLVSEWVGGCTNKCIKIVRVRKEQKKEEHRVEEEIRVEDERIEDERIEDERKEDERKEADFLAKSTFDTTSLTIGLLFDASEEIVNEKKLQIQTDSPSRSSQSSSVSVHELSPSMLTDLYNGPKNKFTNIVMIDGKMMNENEAQQYANDFKDDLSTIDENFGFLKKDNEDFSSTDSEPHLNVEQLDTSRQHLRKPSYTGGSDFMDGNSMHEPLIEVTKKKKDLKLPSNQSSPISSKVAAINKHVTQVEINFEAPTPTDIEEFFGEKIEEPKVKRRHKKRDDK